MNNKAIFSSIAPLALLILAAQWGPAFAWSEAEVNTEFRLVEHTVRNTYPGGGSQDSREGYGYHVVGWVVEPLGGFITLEVMDRSNCPEEVAKFRVEWSFDRDIGTLRGWTQQEGTWKNAQLFTVTTQIIEDGGSNRCINANVWVGVNTEGMGSVFSVRPTGRTYYNPGRRGNEDHVPGQRNVYLVAPFYGDGGFRLSIEGFPGMAFGAYYSYQGQHEERTARCKIYATEAVAANEENLRRRCGFGGPGWQSYYDNHYTWCMQVDPRWWESETAKRQEALRNCP